MVRYLITFSYDGSNYNGYQKQPNGNTIQDELERVLTIINNDKVCIHASGRTDAKVHAINQKAHFDLKVDITCEKLKKAINSLIKKDIYIKKVEAVDSSFHARFNVKKKEYIYKINIGDYNPFMRNYIFQFNKNLDISKMNDAIVFFKGEHNFKSFTKANDEKDDYIRTIYDALINVDDNIITIKFIGSGFLRYMVRNMVGLLLEIGTGKRNIEDVERILLLKDRTEAGITAKPEGLYLKNVYY